MNRLVYAIDALARGGPVSADHIRTVWNCSDDDEGAGKERKK
jgi:hypothetical protein